MDKTAAIVIGSYLVAFGAGFAVRSLISRWRKRHCNRHSNKDRKPAHRSAILPPPGMEYGACAMFTAESQMRAPETRARP